MRAAIRLVTPALVFAAMAISGPGCGDDDDPVVSGSGGAKATGGAGGGGQSGQGGSGGQGGSAGSGGAAAGGTGGTADANADAPSCPFTTAFVPPTVPDKLKPPAGATLAARFHATGSQIYTCKAATGGAGGYTFQLKAPAADLRDEACAVVGKHAAGPVWESVTDNSKVQGMKLTEDPAPGGGAIAWLLLKSVQNWGTSGVFWRTTYVQRVDTVGGLAPTTGCDAGKVDTEMSVPYTANYYFYNGGAATDGGVDGADAADAASDATADAALD
jgi:hypothetical protein